MTDPMPPSGQRATFDKNEHCITPGWATYQGSGEIRCRWFRRRHLVPADAPVPVNGYSPSNYARCARCCAFLKWFVDGQHRRGSVSREIAVAYGLREVSG